jgi:hypothetical protein
MRKLNVLIGFWVLSGVMSCAKNDKDDGCVKKLSARIQLGNSQSDAEQVLDQCGFTHSFDQKTNMIYGLKHGEKSGFTRQDWSAQIKLDDGRRVTSVKVEKVFTGP